MKIKKDLKDGRIEIKTIKDELGQAFEIGDKMTNIVDKKFFDE